ncbi:MAG: hypothetical protein Q8867_10425 [Bacteroidota bacterium]|nr:hypothetical protein [Bacteroidota bacterium]
MSKSFKDLMPSSHYLQLNEIVELIMLTDPDKMLDIGIGFGKYGFLSREYLELWDGRDKYGSWQRQIDGIEAFEPYLNDGHKFVYSNIFTGNALQILPGIKDKAYDLILMVDVLEHFSKEDGLVILKECQRISRNVLISVPLVNSVQDAVFNNPYEMHKYQWKKQNFKSFPGCAFILNYKSLICYFGEKSSEVIPLFRKNLRHRFIVNTLDFFKLRNFLKTVLRKS